MKKAVMLLAIMLASTVASLAQLTPSGGPDAYGYTWKSSAAAGGPTYRWIDIASRGIRVQNLRDDNLSGWVPMPFAFPLYLHSFSQFRIGSNGYLTFDRSTNLSQPFYPIPAVNHGNCSFVAPYLADLSFGNDVQFPNAINPAQCYYYVNADSAIVSFVDVPFWKRDTVGQAYFRGSNTFQVILSRLDSSITFQYQQMDAILPDTSVNTPNQAVVGIEDATQTLGLEAGLNQIPANGSAVKFSPPSRVTNFAFTDMGISWINNPTGAAFFGVLNQPIPITANFRNYGTQNTGTFNVRARIYKTGLGVIYGDTIALAGMTARQDSTVDFQLFTATDSMGTGSYSLVVVAALPGDLFAGNNTARANFMVVDTAGRPNFRLSYDAATPNQLVPFGAGVYFRPLYYPAEIEATDAFIMSTGAPGTPADTDVQVRIYADNGPYGGPGTMLYDGLMAQSAVVTGAVNTLVLNQPVRITSGGFYISWVPQLLTSTFIGAHRANDPFTQRSYEVINGVFAPYRNLNDNIAIAATMRTHVAVVTGLSNDRTGQVAFQPVFPNPSAERATVSYSLRQSLPVSLTVVDLVGRPVRTIVLGQPAAGDHQVEVNVAGLPPGLYSCTLRAGDVKLTRKLVVQH